MELSSGEKEEEIVRKDKLKGGSGAPTEKRSSISANLEDPKALSRKLKPEHSFGDTPFGVGSVPDKGNGFERKRGKIRKGMKSK